MKKDKPTILLLTNLNNGEEEDIYLGKTLEKHFNIIIRSPLKCEDVEDKVDLLLIRNIWPISPYLKEFGIVKDRWKKKNLKVYNTLNGKGDAAGKNYLCEFYTMGFAVIPSVSKKSEINKLPESEYYFIKPVFGGSSKGCKKVTKKELLTLNLENFIIQPFIDIQQELSFYFIDDKLQHALYTPIKEERWNLKPFIPTKKEIFFANQFVKWNNLPYGLQRIDACKTRDGKLILIEIEDFCPYLSLLELPKNIREKFLDNYIRSLKDYIGI